MMEVEGILCLGAFSISDKKNHVTETMYRVDTVYGKNLTDEEVEQKQQNHSVVVLQGGHLVTLDKLNKLFESSE